jgi:cellulose synthase/poly-beta-1,6-N-acetylglucosamine synthase-like glycosyltransferase
VQDLLIITPLRNEAAHLDRVITAMAAQTRRPDEWVVVDDGSTDTTRATLERRAGELGFMRIVDAPPGQPPGTATRGAHATAAGCRGRGRSGGHADRMAAAPLRVPAGARDAWTYW